jgi:Na+/melibiose symporter-like transporter
MSMDENNKAFIMKIAKSIGCTIVMVIVSAIVINLLANDQSDAWIMMCMFIIIIFTMFFCTFTILDELRKGREH